MKILEIKTNKKVLDIKIHFPIYVTKYENSIEYYCVDADKYYINIKLALSIYTNIKETEITQIKKFYKNDGILIIIKNTIDSNSGGFYFHKFVEKNIYEKFPSKISINNCVIYNRVPSVSIDSAIVKKLEYLIYHIKDDENILKNTINSIKKSYENSGIILESDMIWLNEIYQKWEFKK